MLSATLFIGFFSVILSNSYLNKITISMKSELASLILKEFIFILEFLNFSLYDIGKNKPKKNYKKYFSIKKSLNYMLKFQVIKK